MTDAPGDPTTPSYLRGKHFHPGEGWTNHGDVACRRAVRDSEVLADLRMILERRRAKQLSNAG